MGGPKKLELSHASELLSRVDLEGGRIGFSTDNSGKPQSFVGLEES